MANQKAKRAPIPLPGALLYLAMVMVSSMALAAADWADHLALIPLIGILAGLVGLALSRSLFPGWLAAVAGTCYGLFVTFWLLGETLDPAFNFRERLIILGGRFQVFLGVISRGMENQDPLMVVLLLSVLYWAMATFGAWALFRRRSLWGALIPNGIALLVNAFYYLGEARLDWLLALYVLLGLMLFLFFEIQGRQLQWQEMRSRVPANAIVAVARIGAVLAFFLVLIAWVGPAFAGSQAAESAWRAVSGPWRTAQDRLGNVLYSLRSPVVFVGDEFSDNLALEAGVEPDDRLIMEVAPEGTLSGPGRFYWRSRTYDTYQAGGWQYTGSAAEEFDPREGNLMLPEYEAREAITVKIATNNAVQRTLYLPPQTVWVDRTTDLQVRRSGGEVVDVSAYLSNQPVYRGEVYEAESLIAVPNAAQLREAGDEYPQWVVENYLQVPEEITERTRELARRIAGDLPTPYDKTAAITAWLRSNIEYQRVTEAPPVGREPIDWFIFEYRIGFCNYYASAEVMMLRSLGVPARMAVGYARGEYDPQQALYTVSAEEYHAWPEVYFPDYGWVEFEPTVSQPALVRPEPAPELDGQGEQSLRSGFGSRGELEELRLERMSDLLSQTEPLPEQNSIPGSSGPDWGLIGLASLSVLVVTGLIWTQLDAGWRLTIARAVSWVSQKFGADHEEPSRPGYQPLDTALGRAYLRWLAWWPRLGLSSSPDQTPAERAALFSQTFPTLAGESRALADEYQRQRFATAQVESAGWQSDWSALQRGIWQAYLGRLRSKVLGWVSQPPESE